MRFLTAATLVRLQRCYIEPFEQFLAGLRDESFDCLIASGGGRMKITMDRYEADWSMVERGLATHVLGDARMFGLLPRL